MNPYDKAMKDESKAILAKNIIAHRKRLRLSQRELAERIHVHQTMVARWETAQILPRRSTLESLAELFEVTHDELFDSPTEQTGNDRELHELLKLVKTFDSKEKEVLKTVLEAIAIKRKVLAVVR